MMDQQWRYPRMWAHRFAGLGVALIAVAIIVARINGLHWVVTALLVLGLTALGAAAGALVATTHPIGYRRPDLAEQVAAWEQGRLRASARNNGEHDRL